MPDERIPIAFYIDPSNGDIHRKKGKGDEILEDKVVAKYDAEAQIVFFPNLNFLRLYKTGVVTFLAENEHIVKSFQRADLEPDKPLTKSIPPRPKKTKHDGDKTPAVVEWYSKHKPNEFATRYGVLGTYTGPVTVLVPNWVPRPVDGILEYRGTYKDQKEVSNVIVSLRKTHLTYTPDECDDWDEETPETGEEQIGKVGAARGEDVDE